MLNARSVPPHFAAEGVKDGADVNAAARVFAACEIRTWNKARAGQVRPAGRDGLIADRFGDRHADAVPDLDTADRVGLADIVAAVLVRAGGRAVLREAGSCVDIAAVGANQRCKISALLIPLEKTAVGIDIADGFAATSVVATRGRVPNEA
jgi:hypothetical protein